jgi:hypothetical protein
MDPIVLFGGKFPLSGGVPAIYSAADVEECCCPAPCDCPCTEWPPDEWPCNGLGETHTVDFFLRLTQYISTTECSGDIDSITEYRIKSGPITVTADSITGCLWRNDSSIVETRFKFQTDPFTAWSDLATGVFLRLTQIDNASSPLDGVCLWLISAGTLGDFPFSFYKLTGRTPLFDYPGLTTAGAVDVFADGACYTDLGFFGSAGWVEFSCEVSE